MAVVVKVKYEDTLRRFNAYTREDGYIDLTLDGLRSKIYELFQFNLNTQFFITYVDEDNDIVTMADNNDLDDAFRQGLNPLRLQVSLSNQTNRGMERHTQSRPTTPRSFSMPNDHVQTFDLRSVCSDETLKALPEPVRNALMNFIKDCPVLTSSSISDFVQGMIKLASTNLPPFMKSQEVAGASNGPEATNNASHINDSGEQGIGDVKSGLNDRAGPSALPDGSIHGHVLEKNMHVGENMHRGFHKGVQCDGCGMNPIVGPRYKSTVKDDYDLCHSCFCESGNQDEYTKIDRALYRPPLFARGRAFGEMGLSGNEACPCPCPCQCVPSRPRSSVSGARSMGSSESMVSRPNFYNGLRSPVSQDRAGHQEFGPHGRYHYDGPNEMQNVDVGYYRPMSGGYGDHATGRSMASSDNTVSIKHKYNGSMSPVSRNKMDSENFSNRTHEPYHLEGSFSPYEEVDSYRTRGEVNNGESNMEGEHQKAAWDSSTEYNLLNLESSEVLVKSDPRLNVDQRFYVEGRRQYYTEEEKRVEDASEEIMEQGQLAQGISVPNRQDEGVVQEMRKEVADHVLNREANFESFDPHIAFQETSGQFKEEHKPPNVDSGLKEQDKLADRFASSKITANRTHSPFQNDSVSSMRSPNYHAGRDGVPQSNSYASRSSAMSWRRESNEMRNGSFRRFSSQHGDNNYRPG